MANAVRAFGNPKGFQLTQALKEWSIAIDALCAGELLLLLRKGGIRDPAQPFSQTPRAAVLFPTTEHQAPQFLKQPPLQLPEPDADILLKAWAHITHHFAVQSPAELAALKPFHIWTDQFITERLKWRSPHPLQVLCLRTYQLPEPVKLKRLATYSGCRSWITLETSILVEDSLPILPEDVYITHLKAIETALQAVVPFDLNTYQQRNKE